MKLKLDLHPIYHDSRLIEAALQQIIDDAVSKRAAEVEIIPGKGSGALKKSVLRFLDRPDIKARYHRLEKDGDNWGRLFVHFRHLPPTAPQAGRASLLTLSYSCFCCSASDTVRIDPESLASIGSTTLLSECPSCGSPNRIHLQFSRKKQWEAIAESGYE